MSGGGQGSSGAVPSDSSLVAVSVPGDTPGDVSSRQPVSTGKEPVKPSDSDMSSSVSAKPSSVKPVSSNVHEADNTGMEKSMSDVVPVDVKTTETELSGVPNEEIIDEVIPFAIVNEEPLFQGNDPQSAFSKWVQSQLVYPEVALMNGVQGTVILQFDINKYGYVDNVIVLKGVDKLLDEEAVRVVSSSPKWSPGKHIGMPVKTRFVFPVQFKLR